VRWQVGVDWFEPAEAPDTDERRESAFARDIVVLSDKVTAAEAVAKLAKEQRPTSLEIRAEFWGWSHGWPRRTRN
jgi:hypothetical protein